MVVSPLQHEEVDIGEITPARCLQRGLWLSSENGVPFAVLISPAGRFGIGEGIHLEIAVPPGEVGMDFSRKFLHEVNRRLAAAHTYRGKILSFEVSQQFTGSVSGVRVHKLGVEQVPHSGRNEEVLEAHGLHADGIAAQVLAAAASRVA